MMLKSSSPPLPLPLSFYSSSPRRAGVPGFPVKGLHRRKVKQHLVELYAAFRDRIKKAIKHAKSQGCKFSVSMDLWDEIYNKRKYMGKSVAFSPMHRILWCGHHIMFSSHPPPPVNLVG